MFVFPQLCWGFWRIKFSWFINWVSRRVVMPFSHMIAQKVQNTSRETWQGWHNEDDGLTYLMLIFIDCSPIAASEITWWPVSLVVLLVFKYNDVFCRYSQNYNWHYPPPAVRLVLWCVSGLDVNLIIGYWRVIFCSILPAVHCELVHFWIESSMEWSIIFYKIFRAAD